MKGRPRPGRAASGAASGADGGAITGTALAAILVHGLKPAQVVLAGHDPRWARRFAARATELRRVGSQRARLAEHATTAVPGLAASPVADILADIDDPDDEAAFLPGLEAAGYDLTVREPQHRRLRAGDPGEPASLHCCYPSGHPESASCSGITCAATLVTGGATRRPNGTLAARTGGGMPGTQPGPPGPAP